MLCLRYFLVIFFILFNIMVDIFLGVNIFFFFVDLNLNIWFVVFFDYVKGVILYVFLNYGVILFLFDELFDVEDGVFWVGC